MQLKTSLGVANTGAIMVNKAISTLLLVVGVNDLANEKISIEIERANGENLEITKGGAQLIRNLVETSLEHAEAGSPINSLTETGVVYAIELTEEGGAIFLEEKENVKVVLSDLVLTTKYSLYGLEEPYFSDSIRMYEEKTMSIDDKEKTITVTGFDVMAIDDSFSDVTEISLMFENGLTVKMDPNEIRMLNAIAQPVSFFKKVGAVLALTPRENRWLTLPLVSVDTVTIRKNQGRILNITTRRG